MKIKKSHYWGLATMIIHWMGFKEIMCKIVWSCLPLARVKLISCVSATVPIKRFNKTQCWLQDPRSHWTKPGWSMNAHWQNWNQRDKTENPKLNFNLTLALKQSEKKNYKWWWRGLTGWNLVSSPECFETTLFLLGNFLFSRGFLCI